MNKNYLNKDLILNKLSQEDIRNIVIRLGSAEPKMDNKGNYIFQTICHNPPGPSNSYKLYYYHEADGEHKGKAFHCYSGCGDTFNIIELVIRANRIQGKNITWYKALRWIAQFTGQLDASYVDKPDEIQIEDFSWMKNIKKAQKRKRGVNTLQEIDENILDIFCYNPHEEWINDNCSREAINRFGIGYYGLTNQIIIPHRDKDDRLIGIRGRYLDQEDIENIGKYVPLQIDGRFLSHQLGSNLYGIDVVQDKIKSCKKVMLVEAEKSCVQSYSYFGDDSFVVAVCGSSISLSQRKLILEYLGVTEIIWAPDRDYHEADSWEAEAWMQKQLKILAPLVPYVKVSLVADKQNRLGYKDSPTDRGLSTLLELLEEKIEVNNQLIAEYKEKNNG